MKQTLNSVVTNGIKPSNNAIKYLLYESPLPQSVHPLTWVSGHSVSFDSVYTLPVGILLDSMLQSMSMCIRFLVRKLCP